MLPMPNRSRLLRFPEGTVINHRYLLVSPGDKNAGGSGVRAAASAKGAEVSLESAEEPPSSCPQRSYAAGSYVAPLGHGGSSVVFLARQVVFGAHSRPQSVPRAVKFYLLSPTLARHCDPRQQQAANIRNLSNEIENLTSVHHANILKVIDTGVCVRGGAGRQLPGDRIRARPDACRGDRLWGDYRQGRTAAIACGCVGVPPDSPQPHIGRANSRPAVWGHRTPARPGHLPLRYCTQECVYPPCRRVPSHFGRFCPRLAARLAKGVPTTFRWAAPCVMHPLHSSSATTVHAPRPAHIHGVCRPLGHVRIRQECAGAGESGARSTGGQLFALERHLDALLA